jgi:hypothetical protein
MELAARRRVCKRAVSFGPPSRTGAQAWDTFQTLVATTAKLGVGFFHCDRVLSLEGRRATATDHNDISGVM